VVRLGVVGLVTCKNAIEFDHHGGCRRHTVAMGPHSRQQIIQQSTNMLCGRSTSLKLEKNVFITSDLTINARRIDDDNARMIAFLAPSPPVVSKTLNVILLNYPVLSISCYIFKGQTKLCLSFPPTGAEQPRWGD